MSELQAYMDRLLPPLNAALNALARQRPRPEEPLRSLLALLKREAAATETTYTISPALRELLEGSAPRGSLRADEVVAALVRAGALVKTASRDPTRDSCEEEEVPAPAARTAGNSHARALWQRALKPALQHFKSHENAWAKFEIHKQPTELCKRWDVRASPMAVPVLPHRVARLSRRALTVARLVRLAVRRGC